MPESAAHEQEKWDSRYEEVMARVREIARPYPGDPQRSPEEVMEYVRAIAEESGARQCEIGRRTLAMDCRDRAWWHRLHLSE